MQMQNHKYAHPRVPGRLNTVRTAHIKLQGQVCITTAGLEVSLPLHHAMVIS